VEDANKIKRVIFVMILIVCPYNIFSDDNIFISNLRELQNKNYMADIKLVITYNTGSNRLVYKYATASIEIITLYANGEIINSTENNLILSENVFFTENAEENEVVSKFKTLRYSPESNDWRLFFMPRGYVGNLRYYHIPWATKELKIIYRIMYPPKGYSEQKETVLKIRN
jgi:hypothetical protein